MLTDRLKRIARYLQKESGIEGKQAYKLFLDRVKTAYYNATKEGKLNMQADWDRMGL